MTLPYGNPLPPDFVDGNELTAAEFNAVKNYWVTDELPDTAEDGDVVFVIEGEPAGGGADLVGGVAGWATIESVSGAASLDDLKAAGIAPESAIADNECPGTYNITADGVVWRVAVFTGDGSITTSDGVVDALILGSGSSRSPGSGASNGAAADAGGGFSGFVKINDGTNAVLVGQSVSGNTPGIESSLSDVIVRGGIGSCGFGAIGTPEQYTGITSDITGTEIEYGVAAGDALLGWGPQPVSYGSGSLNSGPTPPGAVVVRAPKDAANNPKPDVSMPWGDFTTNGDEDDSGEWGPDGEGRTWKWAEWNDSTKTPTVNLTGGLYWVLTVGGGDAGWTTANQDAQQGQPGTINEGYWEFSTGATSITVGSKSLNANSTTDFGMPSSIGNYGTQGIQSFGHALLGRGGTTSTDPTGYTSTITGTSQEYATGYQGTDRPGRAGRSNTVDNRDGCVIIATVTNDPSEWNPPGALPGLGGWATITAVSGDYTPHRYNDGVMDWVAYEWTDDGTLETQAGGLVDALLVAAGGGGNGPNIGKGLCLDGIREVSTTNSVVVPAGGVVGKWGLPAQLGAHATDTNYHWDTNWPVPMSFTSAITGTNKPYGRHQQPFPTTPNTGDGGDNGAPGASGTVIVRVPAANAQGVSETRHSWLNFATVENGVVTSVNKTPDNIPYTTAVDEIPCGPEVAEGWNYDGSEFVAPKPDHSEQIKELEEKLKNLRSAK